MHRNFILSVFTHDMVYWHVTWNFFCIYSISLYSSLDAYIESSYSVLFTHDIVYSHVTQKNCMYSIPLYSAYTIRQALKYCSVSNLVLRGECLTISPKLCLFLDWLGGSGGVALFALWGSETLWNKLALFATNTLSWTLLFFEELGGVAPYCISIWL